MLNSDYFRAGNPSTPANELRELRISNSAEVRLRLAENLKCPADILAELSVDQIAEIRAAVGSNPSAPLSIVERVADDTNPDVRTILASEPGIPPSVLNRLAIDRDEFVRQRAQRTLVEIAIDLQLTQPQPLTGGRDSARLGDLIVMAGILTQEEVNEYLAISRETGMPLPRVLVKEKALSQLLILQLLNVQAGLRKGEHTLESALAVLHACRNAGLSQRKTQQMSVFPPRVVAATHSELRIRALIDAAPDAVVVFDDAGTVLEWSKQAEVMFGFSRRQVLGQPVSEVLLDGARDGEDALKRLLSNPCSTRRGHAIEMLSRESSGGSIEIEITISKDDSDNSPFIAFIRDISERKKAERRRLAQYSVTRKLSQAQSLEQDGAEMLRIMCETTGFEIGELFMLSDDDEYLNRIVEWHRSDAANPADSQIFTKGDGVPGYVWQTRRPAWVDGCRSLNTNSLAAGKNMSVLALPVVLQNQLLGVLCLKSGRPIRMPDKDSIEMLANCCAQIAQFIERERAEKAKQKVLLLQQREDFMATLAHDLKTPLISGERVLELLINGSLGELHGEQLRVLSMLRESNQVLLHMVQNLLAVYRYESGVEQLHLELSDLRKLVTFAADEIRPMLDHKGVQLTLEVPDWFDPLLCDSFELRRVMSNLLSNAVKFTPAGGKIHVTLEDCREERAVKIIVADTGIGIPESQQKNIFRRFWQSSKYHRAIGTGLGLHLCRNIIEAHSGKITCESKEKQGSTFTIYLQRSTRHRTATEEINTGEFAVHE
ncbi:MAG TPA: ATP-binding protein [Planktothrix sp.]|jgi:PAS domain S-box-containing protein